MPKKIYFVSTNKRKVANYSKRLSEIGFELIPLSREISESRDFAVEDVAKKKLEIAAREFTERPLFVEDRGLEIKSLNNFPGSNVKIVTELMGIPKLQEILSISENDVLFKYAISFIDDMGNVKNFSGFEDGRIRTEKSSKIESLYDVFCSSAIPDKTLSELNADESNVYEKYWTQSDAMSKFINYLKAHDE